MKHIIFSFALFVAVPNVASTVVSPAPTQYADGESSVVCALPEANMDSIVDFSLQIEAQNVLTNQFEVWFCADMAASPEYCNFAIGVDCGRAFVRGLRLDSEIQGQSVMGSGSVAVTSAFRVSSAGRLRQLVLNFNGSNDTAIDQAISALLPSIKPKSWRSIKVVSRGLLDNQPVVIFDATKLGFVIRVCQL